MLNLKVPLNMGVFMEFQRARTEEQVASRQEEIIAVCDAIYCEKGYEAVHFKAVSKMTTISRPTIYNYYKTKEEIFLDIIKRDFVQWTGELKTHFEITPKMTKKEICFFLTDSLVKHQKYFELFAVYIQPIEMNSSLEKLTSFKKAMQPFSNVFLEGLDKYFPNSKAEEKRKFLFNFQAAVHGVFPLTHLSKKQIEAMKKINPEYKAPDFSQKCFDILSLLIANL
jgi:AcrR family transcriptional regulator